MTTDLRHEPVDRPSAGQRGGPPSLPSDSEACRLAGWDATPIPDVSVPVLIDRQATATPDAVAVASGGGRLDYAELTARANRLAHELRARGVARGSVVGLCLRPDVDVVVAVLAVLKADAAFLPVDPDHPASRIEYLLDDTDAVAVVTKGDLAGMFAGRGRTVVDLDRDSEAIAARPVTPPSAAATPEDLAYVLYTSGSTGRPKGVLIPHRGVVNLVVAFQRRYRLTARDRVLEKSPFTFDGFIRDVFWPLSAGARVVVAPGDMHLDALALADFAAAHGVTHMHFVPSLLDVFLDVTTGFPGSCREVFCGGEVLRAATVRRLCERASVSVHNMYGPTEITVNASVHDVDPVPVDPLPIGDPLANIQVRVLDAELNPVPAGVPGEIYLGGAGLAWGYLGRSALTAGRFVADPAGGPGARLFRTGDRGRRRPDGRLEFLGRQDDQIKIRGVRIEPGEIEVVLTGHSSVLAAAVAAHRPADGDALLIAYVVPASGAELDVAALRGHLAAQLPDALIPNHFVALDRLPLTSSGKLDRRALPSPHLDDRRCAPFSQVSAEDRDRLPAGLADAYPMSELQTAMLFEMLADDEVHPYHNVTSYPIHDDGEFSAPALHAAAHAMVMRHDVLRTSFDVTTFSEPLQLVHRTAPVDVAVDDLRGRADGEQRAELARALERERLELFDTERAPLWRLRAHQTDDRRWWLTLVECHPILDGWSRQTLLTELLRHYRRIRDDGCAPPADPPAVRFADFVAAERTTLVGEEHRRFWLERLGRHARFTPPEDWADPIGADRKVSWCFPTEHLDAGLRRLADAAGASLKSVYLAGYLTVLRPHAPCSGFFIGMASDGRLETRGGDEACGMHLNTVPFMAEPEAAATWRHLVANTFAEEAASRPHRRYPLPALQRAAGLGTPLIQAQFSYLDDGDGDRGGDRPAIDLRRTLDDSPTEFPLAVTVMPGRLEVTVRSSRVSGAQARLLGEEYLEVLRAMAADPDGAVGGTPAANGRVRPATRPAFAAGAAPSRPGDGLERTIAGVWSELLGVEHIGLDDDFVVLGGHSLTAMRVAARLRADHGVQVSPRDVLRHRTVAALVDALGAGPDEAAGIDAYRALTEGKILDRRDGSLVWFRRSGTRPPLFCVHDSATHCFGRLAEALGPDQPVAAIQDPAMVEPDRAGAPIEDLAALYAADLRTALPDGPYHILAWCAGASVGWELAHRLAGAGAPTVLCLLDATLAESVRGAHPGGHTDRRRSRVELLRTCEALFGRLLADPDGPDAARSRAEILGLLRYLFPESAHDTCPEELEEGWPEVVRARRAQAEARQAYRYEPFPGQVELLVGDEVVEYPVFYGDITSYDEYVAGWRRLAPTGLSVHRVSGQHAEVLEPPQVAGFSGVLAEILAS
jgi:amino acid adenylation domain-containing protein